VPDINSDGTTPTEFRHPEIVEPFLVVGEPVLLELGFDGQAHQEFADARRSRLLRGMSNANLFQMALDADYRTALQI
jgi:hypothetical protein